MPAAKLNLTVDEYTQIRMFPIGYLIGTDFKRATANRCPRY